MPGFSTEVPHQFDQESALEKLRSFLDTVEERFKDQVSAVEGEWTDNVLNFSLTTFGFKIEGVITVEDKVARVEGKLPFAAAAFKGKIESSIKDELQKVLS